MIICDQLINNSQEQITAANLGAKLHSIQMLMDLGFKVAALDKGIGSALALSWKVGKVAGTVLGNELFGEREKSYSALVKSFGADLAKSLFGDKVGGLVKIGTTTWSTLDDSTKVIQLTAEWTKAIDQIRDAREKIAYYQERQFDIQENIKAIETELRDKYAIGPGLPKVR